VALVSGTVGSDSLVVVAVDGYYWRWWWWLKGRGLVGVRVVRRGRSKIK